MSSSPTESEKLPEQKEERQPALGNINNASELQASYNPSVSDEENDGGDMERIRGDAIGNTLYSERFVLNTLLKLNKIEKELAEDEEFEKELCSLWDMTIEEDVVELLLGQNVLDIFAQCINDTEDKRLTEILVGMIGNMCSVKRTRDEIIKNDETMTTLLGLIGCSDALTLIQLMRLLSVIFVNADASATKLLFEHFCKIPTYVHDICFILSNSINESLLRHTLEALNAILAKFALTEPQVFNGCDETIIVKFEDVFVTESMVSSTCDAFQSILPKQKCLAENDESKLPTHESRKTMQIFLNIHCILVQYDEDSRSSYKSYDPVLECLIRILESISEPICLLPLTNADVDIIDNISDILLVLGDPFKSECMCQMIKIWYIVVEDKERQIKRPQPTNQFEEDDELQEIEVNVDDFCATMLDLITRIVYNADVEQLRVSLQQQKMSVLQKLLKAIYAMDGNIDVKESYVKIRNIVDNLGK